jgi:hypothetical protein
LDNLELAGQCRELGCCILPSVFRNSEIEEFRTLAVGNLSIMGQTRDVAHSYHLAGFHRFPTFSAIHARIVADDMINQFLSAYYGGNPYYAIGLSDITVNRSQQWHTDLLRGRYGDFLKEGSPWSEPAESCVKALVYLQDGASLRIVQQSHLAPTPLDDVLLDDLAQSQDVVQVKVSAGDVVIMDIRALHRGSTDEEMRGLELADTPKILFSTVFGPIASAFTQAMQVGNAHRMAEWDRRFLK